MSVRPLATFRVGRHVLGVGVDTVQEILGCQEVTRVPLAPPSVAGLVNLRGQVVPAVDLRLRLGLPARAPGSRPANVVVRTDDGVVSLLVDGIGDVVEVRPEDFESLPGTLPGPGRHLVSGAYTTAGHLLLVLDVGRATDTGSDA